MTSTHPHAHSPRYSKPCFLFSCRPFPLGRFLSKGLLSSSCRVCRLLHISLPGKMSQPSPRQTPQQTFTPFRKRDSPQSSPAPASPRTPNQPTPSPRPSPSRAPASSPRPDAPKRTRLTREARRNPPEKRSSNNNDGDNDSGDDDFIEHEDEYEWLDPIIPILVYSPFVFLVYSVLLFTFLCVKAWMAGIPLESMWLFL